MDYVHKRSTNSKTSAQNATVELFLLISRSFYFQSFQFIHHLLSRFFGHFIAIQLNKCPIMPVQTASIPWILMWNPSIFIPFFAQKCVTIAILLENMIDVYKNLKNAGKQWPISINRIGLFEWYDDAITLNAAVIDNMPKTWK